jgi:hypothetical protein
MHVAGTKVSTKQLPSLGYVVIAIINPTFSLILFHSFILLLRYAMNYIIVGLLTRNNSLDFELPQSKYSQKKLFNTLIRNFGYCGNYSPFMAMQISSGNPSMSNNTQVITLDTFKKFLETRQMETRSETDIKMIIEVML